MNDEARVIHDINAELASAGLNANIVVRDLDSRREISTSTDAAMPIASVVKIPIALALLTRISEGDLDGSQPITIEPERFDTAGQTGTSRFHHPAQIALDDLVMLSVCFSDNTATDALLDIVAPAEIQSDLDRLGVRGIHIRHHLGGLLQTPLESLPESEAHLAYDLARSSPSPGAGHRIWQLDVSRANVGTAAGLTDLLQEIWRPSRIDPAVASRLRSLMAGNIIRHRLAPDFASDATTWSSKTGTLLNLRHEIGVIDHADGQSIAVTALSESSNPASAQPAAEAALGAAARALHNLLR
ncbi:MULTISPECIES: serine hydrolase [unclassified Brevibacterium]|uniref:serine hydrolase n=1 Tax=unclassified Brevibacterium TaxID=2614124 RepID=UPI001E41A181|nr:MULTISPECIES: serine hydrolase [unclassified Brevibacterium]MCD1285566.1 serine hydrolase [Brevibacterium sp. CCUG 69071]MDK8434620.1 serine hydrolase [Brevibacterium sp. H-BE7]